MAAFFSWYWKREGYSVIAIIFSGRRRRRTTGEAKAHHLLLQCFIVWLKAMDMKLADLVACVCVYCASLFT